MNKDNKDTPGANDNDKMPELPQKFTTVYCEGEKLTEAGEVVDCYSANQMYAYGLKCRYIDPINAFPQDLIYKSIPDAECWAAENKRIVGDMWINGFNECRQIILSFHNGLGASKMNMIKGKELADIIPLTARSQWQEGRQEVCMTYPELLEFSQAIISQVAPQATVEPLRKAAKLARELLLLWMQGHGQDAPSLGAIAEINSALLATSPLNKPMVRQTDEQIIERWNKSMDSTMTASDGILVFARALLAIPPTSKATEQFSGLKSHVARQERENAIDPAYGVWLDERAKQGIEAHGGNEVWDAAIKHCLSTSKADTCETGIPASEIRNAALEEAAKAIWQFRSAENISSSLMQDISSICALVRAMKSTTPPTGKSFDFTAHLARQAAWSEKTFGPGHRVEMVIDHIRKELLEIEAAPQDLEEWVDLIQLALDGAWRSGASPSQIFDGIIAKQTKNEGRTWPDWRTADPTKAIEHIRSKDAVKQSHIPRSFVLHQFADRYGHACSLQKSSLATEDAVWFGLDGANPQVMARDAAKVGIETTQQGGWVPYPIPDSVLLNTRMHLTCDRVKELLPYLKHFSETGDLLVDIPAAQALPVVAEKDPLDLWYLQDTRSYVGNDVLWWAKDGLGYTTDVSKAHVFQRDEAFRQAAMRGADKAWPKNYIDNKTRPAVDMQEIDHAEAISYLQG